MNDPALRVALVSTEATEQCGACFARSLPGLVAQQPVLVFLEGELGAGKTTWARGFLRALGITGPVRSPSYTLLEAYACDALTVVHLDLYRLQEPRELEQLGLRDLHTAGHLWLVEWPDRGSGELPMPDLRIRLESGARAHHLAALGVSDLGRQWVQRVAALTSSQI